MKLGTTRLFVLTRDGYGFISRGAADVALTFSCSANDRCHIIDCKKEIMSQNHLQFSKFLPDLIDICILCKAVVARCLQSS